jgi:hypothetical protein
MPNFELAEAGKEDLQSIENMDLMTRLRHRLEN